MSEISSETADGVDVTVKTTEINTSFLPVGVDETGNLYHHESNASVKDAATTHESLIVDFADTHELTNLLNSTKNDDVDFDPQQIDDRHEHDVSNTIVNHESEASTTGINAEIENDIDISETVILQAMPESGQIPCNDDEHDVSNTIVNHESDASKAGINVEVENDIHRNDVSESVVLQTGPEADEIPCNDDESSSDQDSKESSNNNDHSSKLVKQKEEGNTKKIRLTVVQKIDLVLEGKETSMSIVAKKYGIARSAINEWNKNLDALWEKAKLNPNATNVSGSCRNTISIRKSRHRNKSDNDESNSSPSKKKQRHGEKHHVKFTILEKISIALAANATKDYSAIAKKFNIDIRRLRYWGKQLPMLQEKEERIQQSKALYQPNRVTLSRICDPTDDSTDDGRVYDPDASDYEDGNINNHMDDVSSSHPEDHDDDDESDEESCCFENILSKYADDNGDESDDESFHVDENNESSDESLEEMYDEQEVYYIKEAKNKNANDSSGSVHSDMNERARSVNHGEDEDNNVDGVDEEDSDGELPFVPMEVKAKHTNQDGVDEEDSDGELPIVMIGDPPPKKRHRKHRFVFNVKQKIDIAMEAIDCKNIRATARKYNLDNKTVCYWIKNMSSLQEKAIANPTALTCGIGAKVNPEKCNIEQKMTDWVTQKINNGVMVSTNQIREKASEFEPSFYDGDERRQQIWVYAFLRRSNIVLPKLKERKKPTSRRKSTTGLDNTVLNIQPTDMIDETKYV